MSFCTECGAKLEGTPKFCPECGNKFVESTETIKNKTPLPESNSTAPTRTPPPPISSYELGIKLEEVVESIYKADGYSTQKRQRIQGIRSYTNEIDIIAIRGEEKIAIECKNFSSPVGISQVRDFSVKIQDLGQGWRGVFVGYCDFTEDASEFAEGRNIEKLSHDEVMERWFEISVGRTGKRGEKIVIEHALQVKTDFLAATSLDFVNKDKVKTTDVKLVFHPYIRYKYQFKKAWRDPTKQVHNFDDKGTVVIDLLNSDVLNPAIVRSAEGIVKVLSQTFTSKGVQENKRRKTLLHEVIDNLPLSEISITIGEDYRVTKLAVDYAKRDVKRIALDYIIDKNSRRVSYSVESRNAFPETRTCDFVPERKDISIDVEEIVYVPKWSIYFNAVGTVYTREVLACSGKILEDTIAHCPKHFKLGVLELKQKNIGVCEKCGSAFCKLHGRQCEVCKIWLCEDHATICSSCKKSFCREHITKKCSICGADVCDDCIKTCPICGKEVGKDHLVKCDSCGSMICSSCVTVSGLIKKRRECRKCQAKK